MPIVTKVRKERSSDGTHEHIAGVCLQDGTYRARVAVVAGLDAGQDWRTFGGGTYAVIHKVSLLPGRGLLPVALRHHAPGPHDREQPGQPASLLRACRTGGAVPGGPPRYRLTLLDNGTRHRFRRMAKCLKTVSVYPDRRMPS